MAAYLVACLDERGYLPHSIEEVAEPLNISVNIVQKGLTLLQNLEPAGIGARNLKECLLLQLARMDASKSFAATIIQNDLEAVANHEIAHIALKYDKKTQMVSDAIRIIQSLQPKPSNGYAISSRTEYIIPDIVIEQSSINQYDIHINQFGIPVVEFHHEYFAEANETYDHATAAYIARMRTLAENLVDSLHNRHSTLEHMMRILLEHQREFFTSGPKAMQVLTMRQIADAMHVHPSTISRAVKGKSFSCKWGTYPLKSLFVRSSVKKASATQPYISASQVCSKISALISCEERTQPYSDQRLSELLQANGILISRRCVAKYRLEMEIPGCRDRKSG